VHCGTVAAASLWIHVLQTNAASSAQVRARFLDPTKKVWIGLESIFGEIAERCDGAWMWRVMPPPCLIGRDRQAPQTAVWCRGAGIGHSLDDRLRDAGDGAIGWSAQKAAARLRWRQARWYSVWNGQAEAMAILIRRTLLRTWAPIFNSLS
jgi:hypothetical protein